MWCELTIGTLSLCLSCWARKSICRKLKCKECCSISHLRRIAVLLPLGIIKRPQMPKHVEENTPDVQQLMVELNNYKLFLRGCNGKNRDSLFVRLAVNQ